MSEVDEDTPSDASGAGSGEPTRKRKRKEEDPIAKQARLAKEAEALKASVLSADISALKHRVAGVLNLFPQTRNSDVSLALKYWETFQRDIYNPLGIAPADLFKLERVPNIVRVRQKIQNEYGLFVADDAVRKRRRGREDDIKEAVVEDPPARQFVSVFSDETGKTDRFAIVAAVWVLTGYAVYSISRAIDAWQDKSEWAGREIHFKDFRKNDVSVLPAYLDVIEKNRQYLSFKAIAVDQARTRRSISEIVRRLHEYMLIRGAQHEVDNKRIELPFKVNLTIDEEQSLDDIALADMQAQISGAYKRMYGDQLVLENLTAKPSHQSQLIQLADLVAGAVNRRRNYRGDRNHKDEMADAIIDRLGLIIEEGDAIVEADASVFLTL